MITEEVGLPPSSREAVLDVETRAFPHLLDPSHSGRDCCCRALVRSVIVWFIYRLGGRVAVRKLAGYLMDIGPFGGCMVVAYLACKLWAWWIPGGSPAPVLGKCAVP